ncbi:MAG: TraB/GumN family protein [Pseudomonadota bacterium]
MRVLKTSAVLALIWSVFGLAGCDIAAPDAIESAPERAEKAQILAEFDAALTAAQSTSGPGEPVLWTLSDEDTDIYMFGTVHLLRPDLAWRTEAFDAALDAADTIVFEVDMDSEKAQRAIATDFLTRGVFQDGRTLRDVLSDEDEAVISAAFESLGVPFDAINTFEPWMASINLSMMSISQDGYDPESGVERVIFRDVRDAGKQFAYLETINDQADAFDLLPEADQVSMLYETALLLDESPRMLDLLVEEWADGDMAGIEALMANSEAHGFTDAAYQSVLVKRNQNWLPKIEAMLDEPGTFLIAAGAGHFAGPDSVIAMLRERGYTIEGP